MTGDGRELRRAIARLRKESAEMSDASGSASCEGLVANFKSPDNVFDWEAYIQGPEGSFFEYGVFKDYPMSLPTMKFIHPKIFHPNIYPEGEVCISILHPAGADPTGYESASERWTPAHSVEKILLSVISLLAEPNISSPANVDAAKMFRENIEKFKKIADKSVRESLNLL